MSAPAQFDFHTYVDELDEWWWANRETLKSALQRERPIRLRCRCGRVLGTAEPDINNPAVIWEGQSHLFPDGTPIGRNAPGRRKQPRLWAAIWDSTAVDRNTHERRSAYQTTFRCHQRNCGVERRVSRRRQLEALLSALLSGADEIVLGVDM